MNQLTARRLQPSLTALRLRPHHKRFLASQAYTDLSRASDLAVTTTPVLTSEQRQCLDSALRVDQAGEIAANWIYHGQTVVLGRDPRIGPLVEEMWEQEKKHLLVMDKLQIQHRIRPTVLSEVAKVAGFGLGVATAVLGKEAAMACTEAVETVIGEHYDDQLREMNLLPTAHESVSLLKEVLKEFRDDELEHLGVAVENFSQRAPAHALLSTIVSEGCKIAIQLCKRF